MDDQPKRKAVDLYKLKSLTNLIVYGYIRPMEINLSLSTKIIPLSIIQMILRYASFQTANIQLFAIIAIKKKLRHKHSLAPPKFTKQFIYIDPFKQKTITLNGINITNDHINMCFMNNIQLSNNAMQYFTKIQLNAMKQRYSAIVTITGNAPYISLLKQPNILKDSTNDTMQLFTNALPKIKGTSPHKIIYSNYYGLISDADSQLCALQFDSEDAAFEWQNICKLNQLTKDLYLIHSYSSVDDKVFCYSKTYYDGQHNYIYSLKDGGYQVISDLPDGFARDHFGIYYDITTESLYILGGDGGCGRIVNRYDFNKNIWSTTATTQFEHPYYPFAWMDGFIMYIAGGRKDRIGTVECYDTRYNRSHWILANKSLQIDQILPPCKFKQIFGNNVCE